MKYAELHCASAFSFLEGASQPEDLVEQAAELELGAVALVDRNTLSGAPRFWKAAKEAGIKPLVGAEIVLDENPETQIRNEELGIRNSELAPTPPENDANDNSKLKTQNSKLSGPLGLVPNPLPPGTPLPRLTLLAVDHRGYRNLCRLLTEAARGGPRDRRGPPGRRSRPTPTASTV